MLSFTFAPPCVLAHKAEEGALNCIDDVERAETAPQREDKRNG